VNKIEDVPSVNSIALELLNIRAGREGTGIDDLADSKYIAKIFVIASLFRTNALKYVSK
jgi:hypothetical protein